MAKVPGNPESQLIPGLILGLLVAMDHLHPVVMLLRALYLGSKALNRKFAVMGPVASDVPGTSSLP